jgi:hypothetical protein
MRRVTTMLLLLMQIIVLLLWPGGELQVGLIRGIANARNRLLEQNKVLRSRLCCRKKILMRELRCMR